MKIEKKNFSGGKDLNDMLLSLYCTKLKSKKWYTPIFYYLVQIAAITNGCLLYRRHLKQQQPLVQHILLQFQSEVAKGFTEAEKLLCALVLQETVFLLLQNLPKKSKQMQLW